MNQTARQVGGALGVAILVVILGTPTSAGQALQNFHHLWTYVAIMAAGAGVVAAFLGKPRPPVTPSQSTDLAVEVAVGLEEMLDGEIAVNTSERDNNATH